MITPLCHIAGNDIAHFIGTNGGSATAKSPVRMPSSNARLMARSMGKPHHRHPGCSAAAVPATEFRNRVGDVFACDIWC